MACNAKLARKLFHAINPHQPNHQSWNARGKEAKSPLVSLSVTLTPAHACTRTCPPTHLVLSRRYSTPRSFVPILHSRSRCATSGLRVLIPVALSLSLSHPVPWTMNTFYSARTQAFPAAFDDKLAKETVVLNRK